MFFATLEVLDGCGNLAFEAAFTRALGTAGVIPARHAAEVARHIKAFVPDLDDLRDGLSLPALVAALKATIPDPDTFSSMRHALAGL
ncbi:hypothetical protein [Roseovarius autotrophicus]|uniref:hypothetical protein n=1 Tax=Roseovarius autotrophicus TaxID=2824121 RepID=UPI0019F57D76|nr:hypothetical protein [Roseovarius autotrophicus]MBE0452986.1 hypothetical protein [Roseovarius sp.]